MSAENLTITISADTRSLRRALWRARVSFWLVSVHTFWRAVFSALHRARAEILLTFALLGGWAMLTWGIALLTTPKVWPLSGGVLLLSLCGWRLLWTVFSHGLYNLTRDPPRGP